MKKYFFNQCLMQLNKLVSICSAQLRVFLVSYKCITLSICLQVWISSSKHCQKNIIPHSSQVTVTNFWLFIETPGVLHNVQQYPDQSDQI